MEKETPKQQEKTTKSIQQLWAENDELIKEIFANPLKHPIAYVELILLGIYPQTEDKKYKEKH